MGCISLASVGVVKVKVELSCWDEGKLLLDFANPCEHLKGSEWKMCSLQ